MTSRISENFETQEMCNNVLIDSSMCLLMNLPDRFKKQGRCIEAVEKYPLLLAVVPDHFKTQGMCYESVRIEPILLWCVPDHFKAQEMCNQAVHNGSWLSFAPDHFKTQEMCNEVVHAMSKAFGWIPERLKHKKCVKKLLRKTQSC